MSISFSTITSQFASIAALNANFTAIANWSGNVLLRTGGTLTGNIDANSFKILNVGAPVNPTDLVRLQDLSTGGLDINDLVPSQGGNSGRVLGTDGVSVSWVIPPGTPGAGITSLTAGSGLTGGTITTFGTIALSTTGVAAGSYGSASSVSQLSIDAQGRVTSAASTPIAITKAQVIDLGTIGTMAAQSASAYVLGATPVVTGAIVRTGAGAHLWHNSAALTSGKIFFQPIGAAPTMANGDILFEW